MEVLLGSLLVLKAFLPRVAERLLRSLCAALPVVRRILGAPRQLVACGAFPPERGLLLLGTRQGLLELPHLTKQQLLHSSWVLRISTAARGSIPSSGLPRPLGLRLREPVELGADGLDLGPDGLGLGLELPPCGLCLQQRPLQLAVQLQLLLQPLRQEEAALRSILAVSGEAREARGGGAGGLRGRGLGLAGGRGRGGGQGRGARRRGGGRGRGRGRRRARGWGRGRG
mmetsp:Transcript_82027/g.265867  ORF Transcript_82027/g.265867 Transcript_82027/m.265867 type:complete len:228 (-) Transcript_82027:160-843(-)